MPHAILEYSENLSADVKNGDVCHVLHNAVMDSGLFQLQDIKTRTRAATDWMMGAKGRDGASAHVIIYLMEGRTTEQKQFLSQSVLEKLAPKFSAVDSLTVDIRELDPDTYRKTSVKK